MKFYTSLMTLFVIKLINRFCIECASQAYILTIYFPQAPGPMKIEGHVFYVT